MGPILGSLIASALSGIFGIGATAAANKYNSPKSQLKRLRKAGLPLAFMYQGRVNQQSDVPKLSIDPTLGTTQQKNLEQSAPVQANQAAKLAAEVHDLQETNKWKDKRVHIETDDYTRIGTNRDITLDTQRDIQITQKFIKDHEEQLKGIFANVEQKLFDENVQQNIKQQELQKIIQGIKNLASQAGLMSQLKDIRSWEQSINSTLSESLESMPDFQQAVWTILYKLLSGSKL